MIYLTTAYRF